MKIIRLFLLLWLLVVPYSMAHAAMDMSDFARVPLLHEGRVKPADSVARIYLQRFSGTESGASQIFAELLFHPAKAVERPVFLIKDRQVQQQLSLSARSGSLYNLIEIAPGLQRSEAQLLALLQEDPQDWTASQRVFIKLHEDALSYGALLGSFGFLQPLGEGAEQLIKDIGEALDPASASYSFKDVRAYMPEWEGRLAEVIRKKGEDISSYDEAEQSLALLLFHLHEIERSQNKTDPFRIYVGGRWVTPWSLVADNAITSEYEYWKQLVDAYQEGDQQGFDAAARALYLEDYSAVVMAEILYRALNPFGVAALLYSLAVLLSIAAYLWPRRIFYLLAFSSIMGAALAQIAALAARVIILGRPPVGSLYESLLFVSVVVVIAALPVIWRRKDMVVSGLMALAALMLLQVAPVIAPDGDNLETLVAVLNTNFWLATHVICITAGYGVCILAAMLAHLYLWQRIKGERGDVIWQIMYKTAMVALFFTAFGTMLGGIWADQSWGRFWGWDPKENGALLIVLWIVWLIHARLGHHLSRISLAAGFAFLNVVVALAWFGVNLLSVGLHSYGFISGIAAGLTIFCLAEVALICVLMLLARRVKSEA